MHRRCGIVLLAASLWASTPLHLSASATGFSGFAYHTDPALNGSAPGGVDDEISLLRLAPARFYTNDDALDTAIRSSGLPFQIPAAGCDANGRGHTVANTPFGSVSCRCDRELDSGTIRAIWTDHGDSRFEIKLSDTGVCSSYALLSHNIDLANALGAATADAERTAPTRSASDDGSNGAGPDQSIPSDITPVPEPSALALLGLGLAVIGIMSWRRRPR